MTLAICGESVLMYWGIVCRTSAWSEAASCCAFSIARWNAATVLG